jgi:MFS family permease
MKIETSRETKIFYSAAFFNYLMGGIIAPLFIVYLLSIGLNTAQIGILFATMGIASIIFEFPTGLYADNYGRKNSVLIAFGSSALLYIIWFFSKDFYVLWLLSVLLGVASTFLSGAREALMIDNLKLSDDDEKRNSIYTRISVFGNIGYLIGGLLGALLAFYFIKSIWLAAAIIELTSFFLYLFFVKEDKTKHIFKEKAEQGWIKIKKSAKESITHIIKDRPTLLLIIIGIILSLVAGSYSFVFPVLLKETIKIPNYYFGFLGVISGLTGILGAFLGEKITQKKNYHFTISFFVIVLFILYIFFGLSTLFWFSLIIFTFIELSMSSYSPIFGSFFNKFVPSPIRASVLSIDSTANGIVGALEDVLIGFLLLHFSPGHLIIYSSVLFLLIPFILLGVKKGNLKNKEAI